MKKVFLFTALTFLALFSSANSQTKKSNKMKIVFVVSNQVKSETTGYPIGFWLSELAQPYNVFKEAGYDITIARGRRNCI